MILLLASVSYSQGGSGFSIVLHHRSHPHMIVAALSTNATYPCAGYRIRATATHHVDTVTIRIAGLVRPVPCMASFDQASGEIAIACARVLCIRFGEEVDRYVLLHQPEREGHNITIVTVTNMFTQVSIQRP